MWREAGLLLNDEGLVAASNTTESGLPEGNVMREDMISNALVWLSSMICNYIAAGETFIPVPAGDREDCLQDEEPGDIGKSQKSLLEKWHALKHGLDVWYEGLPSTFKPTARIRPTKEPLEIGDEHSAHPFSEIWYALPMCAATMQHYHMARILMLINKPHETTARRSTIGDRFNSYQSIGAETVYHCYEIWCVFRRL